MTNVLYTYQEEQKFYNKQQFPLQLRMVIIGNFKSGKTKLLFKFLLENYFEFEKLVFFHLCFQKEYKVIIKSLQNGLSINQIRTIFELLKHITNIDSALDIITLNDKFKKKTI